MTIKKYYPTILIAYNRLEHFIKTINALSENFLANKTDVFLFIDGPKNYQDSLISKKIQSYAMSMMIKFSSLKIIQRDKNIGLAKNITLSVTEIISQYEAVIVLEDDIVVSQVFLNFMNDALNYYKTSRKIWHISAHNVINNTYKPDNIFFYRVMNCWGWATWADRWKYFKKDLNETKKLFSKKDILKFNLDGAYDFWLQFKMNEAKIIDTWAIFWYATIFLNGGLCVNPYWSYAKNIGLDGSGINSGKDIKWQNSQTINNSGKFNPNSNLVEDIDQLKLIKDYYISNNKFRKLIRKYIKKPFVYFMGFIRNF